MTSTVFRPKILPKAGSTTAPEQPTDVVVPRGVETDVEPPFSEYEAVNGKPFLVDHYELGSLWDYGDMYSDAFKPEVDSINTYLNHVISKGDVNNTTESVKKELKRIEKMINVSPDSRKAIRMGLVAEYANFLLKSENIKRESAKHRMI